MKWFTGYYIDNEAGTVVTHSASKARLIRSVKLEYPEAEDKDILIVENKIKNKTELINWLNAHFNLSNG